MKNLFIYLIISILIIGCNTDHSPKSINLKETKILLKQEGKAEFLYWEFENDDRFWGLDVGEITDLQLYRDSLKMVMGVERFDKAVAKEASQSLTGVSIEDEKIDYKRNALRVHTGALGKIRKINFWEAQLLNYQLGKYPLLSYPTEFLGFIMMDSEEKNLRVYFCSSNQGWPPQPDTLLVEMEKLMEKGWKMTHNLHNHYEKDSTDYVGVLAPSMADAQYFKMLKERFKLGKALITNGFHTVEISSDEFEDFESD